MSGGFGKCCCAGCQCEIVLRGLKPIGGFLPFNVFPHGNFDYARGETLANGLICETQVKVLYLERVEEWILYARDYSGNRRCTAEAEVYKTIRWQRRIVISRRTGLPVLFEVTNDCATIPDGVFSRIVWDDETGAMTITKPGCYVFNCDSGEGIVPLSFCAGCEDMSYQPGDGPAIVGTHCGDGASESDPGYCSPCLPAIASLNVETCSGYHITTDVFAENNEQFERTVTCEVDGLVMSIRRVTLFHAYTQPDWIADVKALTSLVFDLPLSASGLTLPSGTRFTETGNAGSKKFGCGATDCNGLLVTPVQGGAVTIGGHTYDVLAGTPFGPDHCYGHLDEFGNCLDDTESPTDYEPDREMRSTPDPSSRVVACVNPGVINAGSITEPCPTSMEALVNAAVTGAGGEYFLTSYFAQIAQRIVVPSIGPEPSGRCVWKAPWNFGSYGGDCGYFGAPCCGDIYVSAPDLGIGGFCGVRGDYSNPGSTWTCLMPHGEVPNGCWVFKLDGATAPDGTSLAYDLTTENGAVLNVSAGPGTLVPECPPEC